MTQAKTKKKPQAPAPTPFDDRVRTEVRMGGALHDTVGEIITEMTGLTMTSFLTAAAATQAAAWSTILKNERRKAEILRLCRENFEAVMKEVEVGGWRERKSLTNDWPETRKSAANDKT